jgi:hypothetical protein
MAAAGYDVRVININIEIEDGHLHDRNGFIDKW